MLGCNQNPGGTNVGPDGEYVWTRKTFMGPTMTRLPLSSSRICGPVWLLLGGEAGKKNKSNFQN